MSELLPVDAPSREVVEALGPNNTRGIRSWHLGLRARYAGYIHHDDPVWQAVSRRRLFMSAAATSRASREVRQVARALTREEGLVPGC